MTLMSSYSLEEATAHLHRADQTMGRLIDHFGPPVMRPSGEPMATLIRSIMYQQVTGKAAASMQRKMLALYSDDGRMPTPAELMATSDEEFRSAGVSRQKAGYLRDLALHIAEGRLNFDDFDELDDEEVASRLIAVKGIGEWSAHMFLMFQLRRPDILPVGDLGVRNGMKLAYRLESAPSRAEAAKIGAPWAPFRSVGSWYMWRVVEGPSEGW
jgi:DNA-3-methyladenine glycosylase II